MMETLESEEELRLRDFYNSLPPVDETSNDALLSSLIRSRNVARDRELHDLCRVLDEALPALGGRTPNHVEFQKRAYFNLSSGHQHVASSRSSTSTAWNSALSRRLFAEYAANLDAALAEPASSSSGLTNEAVCRILGPKSIFDHHHALASMEERMRFKMSTKQDVAQNQRDFELGDPIQTNLRDKEAGYKAAAALADGCTNASEADGLAKEAFGRQRIWTAELWWEKAIDLNNTDAKRFSNISMLYTKIGRYLRSIEVGYRGLATQYLERAVEMAKRGIAADEGWERSYQRGAEALFALGHHEHAIDVLKLLKPVFGDACPLQHEPSAALKALQAKAKKNAMAWLSLRVIPGRTSVPQTIRSSIENLRKVAIENFALCSSDNLDQDSLEKAGDEVADAALLTLGALQLIYTRQTDWEIQSQQENQLKNDFQIDLREAGKLVPLKLVIHSKRLREFVYFEGPHTLWGLDRLDRLNVEYLKPGTKDPCEQDEGDDEGMNELLQRGTGEGSMSASSIISVLEHVRGKDASSYDQDMSPHHLSAFAMNILERITLTNKKDLSDLRQKAMLKVIELNTSYTNGLHMGGEFIGRVTKAASGYIAFNRGGDNTKFFEFIKLDGGLSTVVREVCQGGDKIGTFQKLLCEIDPQQWQSVSKKDLGSVFYEYCLTGLDGKYLTLKEEQLVEYATTIMSNILTSTCMDAEERMLLLVGAMVTSSFGQFLYRRVSKWIDDDNKLAECKQSLYPLVSEAVDKWSEMSVRKKSAYRWAAMSPEKKGKLADFRPISKAEKFEKDIKGASKEEDDGDRTAKKVSKRMCVTELPTCAVCGAKISLMQCVCELTYYCGETCQKAHWKEHKALHKKAMKK